jgi:hypothetical protein
MRLLVPGHAPRSADSARNAAEDHSSVFARSFVPPVSSGGNVQGVDASRDDDVSGKTFQRDLAATESPLESPMIPVASHPVDSAITCDANAESGEACGPIAFTLPSSSSDHSHENSGEATRLPMSSDTAMEGGSQSHVARHPDNAQLTVYPKQVVPQSFGSTVSGSQTGGTIVSQAVLDWSPGDSNAASAGLDADAKEQQFRFVGDAGNDVEPGAGEAHIQGETRVFVPSDSLSFQFTAPPFSSAEQNAAGVSGPPGGVGGAPEASLANLGASQPVAMQVGDRAGTGDGESSYSSPKKAGLNPQGGNTSVFVPSDMEEGLLPGEVGLNGAQGTTVTADTVPPKQKQELSSGMTPFISGLLPWQSDREDGRRCATAGVAVDYVSGGRRDYETGPLGDPGGGSSMGVRRGHSRHFFDAGISAQIRQMKAEQSGESRSLVDGDKKGGMSEDSVPARVPAGESGRQRDCSLEGKRAADTGELCTARARAIEAAAARMDGKKALSRKHMIRRRV